MKKKLMTYFSVLTLVFSTACNTSKMTFNNGDQWIPFDFNPSKTTLLIETFDLSKKAQQKMEDYMAENYSSKYEFAPLSEIENKSGKYSDLKKYKFAIIYSVHTSQLHEIGKATGGPVVTGFDFNFVDRETGKEYPKTKKSSGYPAMTFKPMINTINKKFE